MACMGITVVNYPPVRYEQIDSDITLMRWKLEINFEWTAELLWKHQKDFGFNFPRVWFVNVEILFYVENIFIVFSFFYIWTHH